MSVPSAPHPHCYCSPPFSAFSQHLQLLPPYPQVLKVHPLPLTVIIAHSPQYGLTENFVTPLSSSGAPLPPHRYNLSLFSASPRPRLLIYPPPPHPQGSRSTPPVTYLHPGSSFSPFPHILRWTSLPLPRPQGPQVCLIVVAARRSQHSLTFPSTLPALEVRPLPRSNYVQVLINVLLWCSSSLMSHKRTPATRHVPCDESTAPYRGLSTLSSFARCWRDAGSSVYSRLF